MEALFAQFSSLADQALRDKNFDTSKLDDLLLTFEREASASWSAVEAEHREAELSAEASMRDAERYLNSLMDTSMEDFHRSDREAGAVEKMGHSLGASSGRAAKRYMDAALTVATATAAATTTKVHPSES